MRRKLAAVFITIAGLGLFGAVPAQADTPIDQYLVELERAGFTVNEDTEMIALTLGLGVCVDMFNGATPADEVGEAMAAGLPEEAARALVNTAQHTLCPRTITGRTLS